MIRKVLIENGVFRTVLADAQGRILVPAKERVEKAETGESLEEKINSTLQKIVRVVESQNKILLELTRELESLRARLEDVEKAKERARRRA